MDLTHLRRGQRAFITAIEGGDSLTRKFLEMGVLEGMTVRLAHVGPIGRDPIAITLDDRCVALRRSDARHIHIELAPL